MVYNDTLYDDRNIGGGLIGEDSIIIFFRKFNADIYATVNSNYIISGDGGITWSPVQQFNLTSNTYCVTQNVIHIPTRGYMIAIYGYYYVELRFSEDGTIWNDVDYKWDYTNFHEFYLSEISFSYCGNGKIIGLIRDMSTGLNSTLYQVTSEDYGYTWTEPVHTNIAAPYTCAMPLVFYDEQNNDIWSVTSDRRQYNGSPYYANESRLWIYRNKPEEIFSNPLGYNLYTSLLRPIPNFHMFYGYPVFTQFQTGEYLLVFTESFKKPTGLEDADFYQFIISYQDYVVDATEFVWSTGDTVKTIEVGQNGWYYVDQYDTLGDIYRDSVFVSMIGYNIPANEFTIDAGGSYYAFVEPYDADQSLYISWSNGSVKNPLLCSPDNSGILYSYISNEYHTCTDSIKFEIINDFNVGINSAEDYENINSMRLYPNPVSENSRLSFDVPDNDSYTLKIIDQNGREVRSEYSVFKNSEHNFNDLNPGTYTILFYNKSNSYSQNIIVL